MTPSIVAFTESERLIGDGAKNQIGTNAKNTIYEAKRLMGIVVDMVSEVVNIQASEIELPPQYGTKVETGFLTGLGKVKGKVVMLLNIETIINCDEMINLLNSDTKGSLSNV